MRRLCLLGCMFALATPVVQALAAGGARTVYFAPGGYGLDPQVRPPVTQLSGDDSLLVRGMHWLSWGASTAAGTGVSYIDNCLPNCAQGHEYRNTVRVSLTAPVLHCGRWFFSRAVLLWPDGRPPLIKQRRLIYPVAPFTSCG